jgi:N6-adenosine-specific RNA methylase IME4
MSVSSVADLDVGALAATDAHLYLWTTNRYLFDAFGIARAWGFAPSQTLTWCKPRMGIGPGIL